MNRQVSKTTGFSAAGRGAAPVAGPIARASAESGEGTISVTLDNSGGGTAATYIVGDGDGIYAAASGLTVSNPDSGSISPTAMKANFSARPMTVRSITYKVTQGSSQFSQSLKKVRGLMNGGLNAEPIPVAKFETSADQNTNVKTLVFSQDREIPLSGHEGFTLDVEAGETVNLEITLGEYRVR